ncbi:MAG: DUF881 domain-containing protein [Nocardioides sp.]|nr:DUF881 domain-containing protein [Nocardioides sp.]
MEHQHRRPRSWPGTVAVGLVLAAAGGLFATSAGTAAGTDLRAVDTDLPGLVRQESSRLEARGSDLSELRAEVEELTAQVGDSTTLDLQATAAGLAGGAQRQAVRGPAVTVTLDDAPSDRPIPDGFGPNDVIVHQQDLQAVVNALWANGAESMMLMDQRVISTSAVRCVGTTLHLQGRVYSPPYVITAIGDRDDMLEGLDDSSEVGLYRDFVRAVGLTYRVEESDDLEMPGYDGSIEMQHAAAASGDGARKGGG